jgi:hypothetical protein
MTVLAHDPVTAVDGERWSPISDGDRAAFDRDGYVLIRSALPAPVRASVTAAVDRVYAEESRAGRLRSDRSLHLLGMADRDPAFLGLLDHPSTFRYVWSLLGWNVYTHHNHLDVHPGFQPAERVPWNWHQDGYRQNTDIDADPRPMLSLKVAFVLSDMSVTGRGATRIVEGSHLRNTLPGRPPGPRDPYDDPAGAEEIVAHAGDAFVFDRRLWHSRSVNLSATTRKIIFIGYTYRWIRPLDEVDYRRDPAWFAGLSPLHRQLLGDARDNAGRWGVRQDGWVDPDIPLRAELSARHRLDGSRPYLR